jgi:hypothetical protein
MTSKPNDSDKKIKTFLKQGGRKNAKSDFFKLLKKSTASIDRKR